MSSIVWQLWTKNTLGALQRAAPTMYRPLSTAGAPAGVDMFAAFRNKTQAADSVFKEERLEEASAEQELREPVGPNSPVILQLVNTIMRDGKRARAQRLVSDSIKLLEQKLDGEDPYQVMQDAIESASPLLKLVNTKKGSKSVAIPTPLRTRQRRRYGIVWILEEAGRRPEKTFEQRFAAEIFNIHQGSSAVLEKKLNLHKQALANRANAQVSYNSSLNPVQ